MRHEPVMINEVINFLRGYNESQALKIIIDGTLGAGGYSLAMLENFPACKVIGIDRDQNAIEIASKRLAKFKGRFEIIHNNFSGINNILSGLDNEIGAFVFDLGVSNMQVTYNERGFSFMNDGPLDMRMNPENDLTASDVLFNLEAAELEKIFRAYGEERYSKIIARAIKKYNKRIETTGELVNIIRDCLPQPVQRKMGTHPARRVFQALRIYVNNEDGELNNMLENLPVLVKNNALVIIVSYHSLEDRIVKNTFRKWQAMDVGKILTRHPVRPSEDEVSRNYKARSAKLRVFNIIRH